ncbi:MAG: hypothetical protein ABIK15_19585 [Pseudomonadota bacterium]
MEIPITIEKHCIETTARRLYEKLMGRYFGKSISGREKRIVEDRMEAILFFLEHADFGSLRHQHSELNGTMKTQVVLDIDTKKKNIAIRWEGKEIPVSFRDGHDGEKNR